MLAPKTCLQQRYVVIEPVGRGGMGAVYRAYDQRLRADVALKQTLFTGEGDRRRFEREAQLLARLRHRGMPKVSDYFTEASGQYLVMEYISGQDLDVLCQGDPSIREPASLPRVLEWADQILDILEYLHNRRLPIVHRDIKPKNLKLSERDEIVLLDFGLARGGLTQEAHLDGATQRPDTGLRIHTLPYGPLEQMRGEEEDPRNDIYSLGATLYYILSGKAPIDPMTRLQELAFRSDPLPPLVEVVPHVPPLLSEIVHTMMAIRKDDRQETASQTREELQQVRNVSVRRPRTQPLRPLQPGNPLPRIAGPVLSSTRPSLETPLRTINTGTHIRTVAWNGTDDMIAAGYDDCTIGLWTMHDSQQIKLLTGHKGVVRSVMFTHDRQPSIISGSDDGAVRLWHVASEMAIELERRGSAVSSAALSADGQWLAVCGWNGGTVLWQRQQKGFVQTRRISNAFTNCVAFSQDGQMVGEGRFDGSLVIWDVQSQQQRISLSDYPASVFCLAFSPDGQYVAAGGNTNTIYLWRVRDGRKMDTFRGHTGSVRGIAWSADGNFLVSVSEDRTARIWTPSEGATRYPPLQHENGVTCLAFHPDGDLFVTGGYDTKLRLWKMPR